MSEKKDPTIQVDSISSEVTPEPPNSKNIQVDSAQEVDSALTINPIIGSGNVQAENATSEGRGGVQHKTPSGQSSHKENDNATNSQKGGTATGHVKGSLGVKDLADGMIVIPGPDRVTHYSLNDSAATKDSIGFISYVRALSKLLCHKNTNTPLVVGVFGEWGAGKTTFMKLLEGEVQRLMNEPNIEWWNFWSPWKKRAIRQTWFNAWKHDVQSDLWLSLLQAITTQVEDKTPFIVLIWRRFRRLLNRRFFFSFLSMLLVFVIGIWFYSKTSSPIGTLQDGDSNTSDIWQFLSTFASTTLPPTMAAVLLYWLGVFKPTIDLVRRLKTPLGLDVKELLHGKSLPDKIERFRTFERELEIRLNDYLTKDGRLIIYIDDLDRCSPAHAVEIIEAVNLFLETERCIFVLGMDDNLIASSIELKYKEISEIFKKQHAKRRHSYGQFFLEKIIQIPLSVPATKDRGHPSIGINYPLQYVGVS